MSDGIRVAMWSGPRNISTALMRSWEARGDTAVWDEPLYAFYLARTGLQHPGAAEVIAAGETDWRRVVERILGPVPGDLEVHYQKHMTHHLLPEVDREWLLALRNCFLIRDPGAVVASYVRNRPDVTVEDVGIVQQAEIHDWLCENAGGSPPVIDSDDVLRAPAVVLASLCAQLGVEYRDSMLRWEPGKRASDGVWGRHWYANVWASTGFAAPTAREYRLEPRHQAIADRCVESYQRLYEQRLRP